MPTPGVSVVIPCYNDSDHVVTAIRSVLNDPWTPLEIIIVDDGSTPPLPDFTSLSPVIHTVRHHKNKGIAEALNTGLHRASHDLVCWLSSDDGVFPGKVAAQVAAFTHPEVVLCFTAYETIDQPTRTRSTVRFTPALSPDYQPPEAGGVYPQQHCIDPDWFRAAMLRGCLINGSTVMMRREAALSIGGFNPQFQLAQDYDFWLRLIRRGKCIYLPTVFGWRTLHPRQISRTKQSIANREDWEVRHQAGLVRELDALKQHFGLRRTLAWLTSMPPECFKDPAWRDRDGFWWWLWQQRWFRESFIAMRAMWRAFKAKIPRLTPTDGLKDL